MIADRYVVGLIPARGGSKGVARKNIRLLGDKPLIVYSIDQAKGSRYLDRAIVSSEDAEILSVARDAGCEVLVRPDELAQDDTHSCLVMRHAIDTLEANESRTVDVLVLLQPTSPFRKAADIDGAIELHHQTGAESVISVVEAPHWANPHWTRRIDEDGRLVPYLENTSLFVAGTGPRQGLPKVYWRDGQLYVVRRDVLYGPDAYRYGVDVRPYVRQRGYLVNIDEEADLEWAEFLLRTGRVQP